MTEHEAHQDRSHADRSRSHHLLSLAGLSAAAIAVLAHLGGAALLHLGLGAVLAAVGLYVTNLPARGALLLVLAVVISVKLVRIFGARWWWRRR